MMRFFFTLLTFLSVLYLPWLVTVLLAVAVAVLEPLVPLAVGLFADTLYYAPHAGAYPLWTILGVLATALAYFVRSRLSTGRIN